MPSLSEARTSSATERTLIFSMMRPRCTLTVFSVVPISAAITLLRLPAITWVSTSRSRGVSSP